MKNWLNKNIKGLLLDISGVLYDGGVGDGTAIPGSIEAVARLQASNVSVRFCSNETQHTRSNLVAKLQQLGFSLKEDQVFTPAPATVSMLKNRSLRPHLLIHPGLSTEFSSCSTNDPNCVVVGDAAEEFTYDNLNKAFQLLMSMPHPILISMGGGMYYKETDGLKLDVGAYAKALEYACDLVAEVVGKPSNEFFTAALKSMNVQPDEALMIGDDITGDIGGAQAAGMRGILVRTGKFKKSWENHPTVKPDDIVNNLAEAVDLVLQKNS